MAEKKKVAEMYNKLPNYSSESVKSDDLASRIMLEIVPATVQLVSDTSDDSDTLSVNAIAFDSTSSDEYFIRYGIRMPANTPELSTLSSPVKVVSSSCNDMKVYHLPEDRKDKVKSVKPRTGKKTKKLVINKDFKSEDYLSGAAPEVYFTTKGSGNVNLKKDDQDKTTPKKKENIAKKDKKPELEKHRPEIEKSKNATDKVMCKLEKFPASKLKFKPPGEQVPKVEDSPKTQGARGYLAKTRRKPNKAPKHMSKYPGGMGDADVQYRQERQTTLHQNTLPANPSEIPPREVYFTTKGSGNVNLKKDDQDKTTPKKKENIAKKDKKPELEKHRPEIEKSKNATDKVMYKPEKFPASKLKFKPPGEQVPKVEDSPKTQGARGYLAKTRRKPNKAPKYMSKYPGGMGDADVQYRQEWQTILHQNTLPANPSEIPPPEVYFTTKGSGNVNLKKDDQDKTTPKKKENIAKKDKKPELEKHRPEIEKSKNATDKVMYKPEKFPASKLKFKPPGEQVPKVEDSPKTQGARGYLAKTRRKPNKAPKHMSKYPGGMGDADVQYRQEWQTTLHQNTLPANGMGDADVHYRQESQNTFQESSFTGYANAKVLGPAHLSKLKRSVSVCCSDFARLCMLSKSTSVQGNTNAALPSLDELRSITFVFPISSGNPTMLEVNENVLEPAGRQDGRQDIRASESFAIVPDLNANFPEGENKYMRWIFLLLVLLGMAIFLFCKYPKPILRFLGLRHKKHILQVFYERLFR